MRVNSYLAYALAGLAGLGLLALFFFSVFETFPRLGWVDPNLYSAYIFNHHLYRVYPLAGDFYQGSRLGFIVPLKLITELFGHLYGRAFFVFGLYIASIASAWIITAFFVKGLRHRIGVVSLFAINPLWIAAITYGGADGPAATYLLMGVAFFLVSLRITSRGYRELLAMASGIFFALSVSCHVFAVVPSAMILLPLLFLFGSWRTFESIVAGGIITIAILSLLGWFLGMHHFYFLQSILWSKYTAATGVGILFRAPFDIWILRSMFWGPVFLAGIFAIAKRPLASAERLQRRVHLAACFNLLGPLLFCILYDHVIVIGDTLGTPSYFNITFPAIFTGMVMWIGQLEQRPKQSCRLTMPIAIASIFLIMGCVSNYTQAVFRFNGAHTSHMYGIAQDFSERIRNQTNRDRGWQFIFRTASPGDPARVYRDYYRGEVRYFDYIDTLVSLFGWSPSLGIRVDPVKGYDPAQVKLDPTRPLIVLARNKKELEQITRQTARSLSSYKKTASECTDFPNFAYCYTIYFSRVGY